MDYSCNSFNISKTDPTALYCFKNILARTLLHDEYTHLYVTFDSPMPDRLTADGYLKPLSLPTTIRTLEIASSKVRDVNLAIVCSWDWFSVVWSLTPADASIYVNAYVARGYEPDRPATIDGGDC